MGYRTVWAKTASLIFMELQHDHPNRFYRRLGRQRHLFLSTPSRGVCRRIGGHKPSPGFTFNRKPCFLIRGQPNSLGGMFIVRQKPPFMRDQLLASASDFNSKHGFMVRSEGREDGNNINNSPRWAKREVHFAPNGALQAQRQNRTSRRPTRRRSFHSTCIRPRTRWLDLLDCRSSDAKNVI